MGSNGPYTWGNGPTPRRPKRHKGDHRSKDGCAVVALAMLGGVVGLIGTAGYGIAQLFN